MRIAICDNKCLEREKYKEKFYSLAIKNNIDADFVLYSSGNEILFHFEEQKQLADIIFIDVHMPDMTGIEVAQKLRESKFMGEIIFLTASQDKQHILSGYDVDALHYIIKDETSQEKIEEIFLRAEKAIALKDRKTIALTSGNELRVILISDIRYFEIFKRIVTVHYENDSFEFYSYSLRDVENQLAGMDFIRIHRSYLVALNEIKSFSYDSVLMKSGKTLPVGRTYYPAVKETLTRSKHVHAVI